MCGGRRGTQYSRVQLAPESNDGLPQFRSKGQRPNTCVSARGTSSSIPQTTVGAVDLLIDNVLVKKTGVRLREVRLVARRA